MSENAQDAESFPGVRRSRLTLFALVAGAVVVVGCGAESTTSPSGADAGREADRFVELFSTLLGDYEPADSPRELAERSDLVVTGQIGGFEPGRVFGPDPGSPEAYSTVVMSVEVRARLRGRLPSGSGDRVYVEFISPGGVEAQVYDRYAPKDAELLLYLRRLAPGSSKEIVDPASGRPRGQPLHVPTTPQGFLLGDAGGVVAQPLDFAQYPGVDLRQFLPERERFPKPEPGAPEEA